MTDITPTKVVVDCSTIASLAQSADALYQQAAELIQRGDIAGAAELAELAAARLEEAASQPTAVTVRPYTDDELEQHQTDQDAAAAAAEAEATLVAEVNEATTLAKRNRWLLETDPYNLTGATVTDIPSDVTSTVEKNLAAIQAWRQELRDYPDSVTDWATPPPLPSAPAISLKSGKPLFRLT